MFKPVQTTQGGRQRPQKIVPGKLQGSHPSASVRGHAEPFIQRFGAQPVGVILPVRSIRFIVERYQRLPIRKIFRTVIDTGCVTDAVQPGPESRTRRRAQSGALQVERLNSKPGKRFRHGSDKPAIASQVDFLQVHQFAQA